MTMSIDDRGVTATENGAELGRLRKLRDDVAALLLGKRMAMGDGDAAQWAAYDSIMLFLAEEGLVTEDDLDRLGIGGEVRDDLVAALPKPSATTPV